MIQKELMLDNIVGNVDFPGEFHSIRHINRDDPEVGLIDDGYYYKTEISKLHGIPLTPEILEKCGFRRHDNYFNHDNFDGFHILRYHDGECVIELGDQFHILSAPFSFLHQLQNLYFALTGKELTIIL